MKDLPIGTQKTHDNLIALGSFHLPLLFYLLQTPVCSWFVLMGVEDIPSLAAFAVFGWGMTHGEQNSTGSKWDLTATSRSTRPGSDSLH